MALYIPPHKHQFNTITQTITNCSLYMLLKRVVQHYQAANISEEIWGRNETIQLPYVNHFHLEISLICDMEYPSLCQTKGFQVILNHPTLCIHNLLIAITALEKQNIHVLPNSPTVVRKWKNHGRTSKHLTYPVPNRWKIHLGTKSQYSPSLENTRTSTNITIP